MYNKDSFAGRREEENGTIRIDIRKGHLSQWKGSNQPREDFDFVQGILKGITFRQQTTAGGTMTIMDIHFDYGMTNFVVSSLASSSISAQIISKLVNVRDLNSVIRIDVWAKGDYTNCTVRENGDKLPYRILPKVAKIQNGFNTTIDSAERDAEVKRLVEELNGRLGYRMN